MTDRALSTTRVLGASALMLALTGVGVFFASSQGPARAEMNTVDQRRRMVDAATAAEDAYQQSQQQLTAQQYSALVSAHYRGSSD